MPRIAVFSPEDPLVKAFVHLPRSLHDAAKKEAARRGLSFSAFVRMVLAKEVGWQPKEGGHGSGEAD